MHPRWMAVTVTVTVTATIKKRYQEIGQILVYASRPFVRRTNYCRFSYHIPFPFPLQSRWMLCRPELLAS
jgi:hypothetical protein